MFGVSRNSSRPFAWCPFSIWPGLDPNRNMLRVEKRVQTFASQLAAPAALFDPAKWRLGRGWNTVVDADHARVQQFCHSEHAPQIPCEDIRAQAVRGMIRQFNRLSLFVKHRDGRDRGKGFLIHTEPALR